MIETMPAELAENLIDFCENRDRVYALLSRCYETEIDAAFAEALAGGAAAAPAPLSLCARLWGRFCRAAGVLFSGCSHICKIHVVEWGQPNKIGSECLEKAMDGAGLYPVSVCQPDPARGSRGRGYRCARRGVV